VERDDSPGRLLHEVRWEAISSVPSELSSSTSDANSLFILFADSALGGDSYLEYLLSKQPNLKHARIVRDDERVSASSQGVHIAINPIGVENYRGALRNILAHFDSRTAETADKGKEAPKEELSTIEQVGLVRTPKLRIVFAWPLDATGDMDAATFLSCGTLLQLTQALIAEGLTANADLVVLTRGAVTVTSGKGNPTTDDWLSQCLAPCAQATVHGFAAVASSELPDLKMTVIDLDPSNAVIIDPSIVAPLLFAERLQEDRLAVRGYGVFAPRVVKLGHPREKADAEKKRTAEGEKGSEKEEQGVARAVVITGGFGGIGKELCRWLGDREKDLRIYLVGRHPPEEPLTWLASVFEKNVREEFKVEKREYRHQRNQYYFLGADISNAKDVAKLFESLTEGLTSVQLRVYHCAGVLRDRIILNQNWESFQEVLAPKVFGAWQLVQGCLSHPNIRLEDMMLFSSISNILGTPGQVGENYALGQKTSFPFIIIIRLGKLHSE